MRLNDRLSAKILGHSNRDRIILVFGEYSTVESLVKIEGANLVLDVSLKSEFVQWLKFLPIDDVARDLKLSRASAGRLRVALGLSQSYKK